MIAALIMRSGAVISKAAFCAPSTANPNMAKLCAACKATDRSGERPPLAFEAAPFS